MERVQNVLLYIISNLKEWLDGGLGKFHQQNDYYSMCPRVRRHGFQRLPKTAEDS